LPPGVELRANPKSISHRCHLFEVAFVWKLTKEKIHLPLGFLQGGLPNCSNASYGALSEEMCSGSEASSHVRLIDFVYHSTLG